MWSGAAGGSFRIVECKLRLVRSTSGSPHLITYHVAGRPALFVSDRVDRVSPPACASCDRLTSFLRPSDRQSHEHNHHSSADSRATASIESSRAGDVSEVRYDRALGGGEFLPELRILPETGDDAVRGGDEACV